MKFLIIFAFALARTSAADSTVDLVTFDGKDKSTTWTWKDLNDPVMGGQSHSTLTFVKGAEGYAVWDGETKVVPSLKAPGFCNLETVSGLGIFSRANHAAGFTHVLLRVRSTIPYDGFKVSFAADTLNPLFKSFKAGFNVTSDGQWQTVSVPFENFSNDWSSYTGRCDTVDPSGKNHTCCSKATPEVCPTQKNLNDISGFGLWTEGVAGKFHLEVEWIRAGFGAGGCADTEYCCPDAKHCLTPTKTSCSNDTSVCSSDETCCPLTKLCVKVGKPCDTPCQDQGTYCCPDAKACLAPTNPGVLCRDTGDCKDGEVCCPLTKICVRPGAACDTGAPGAPAFLSH